MANQIEATIYQIDGNPQAAPITVSFLTSELVIQEALISTIPAVQSAIYYYNVVNNQQSVQTYYASEDVATLVALANNGETSHTQATVLEVNANPQVPGGVQYSFPSAAILIGESINPTTGVNAFIQYKGIKYYTAETQATLYNNSNAGGGGGIIVVGSGLNSSVRCGNNNSASGTYSTVFGSCNTAGSCSVTSGGFCNSNSGTYSFIGGGVCNYIRCNPAYTCNCPLPINYSGYNIIGGGSCNCIDIATAAFGRWSFNSILGGDRNQIRCGRLSSIGGGSSNIICNDKGKDTIGGGNVNTVSGYYATIAGGAKNTVSSYAGTQSGGYKNTISGCYGVGGAGLSNVISGCHASVFSGRINTASGNFSNILGGQCNQATGQYSVLAGGCKNLNNAVAGFIGSGICNNVCNSTSGCLAIGSVVVGGIGNNTTGGTWALASCSFTVAPTICNAGIYSFVGGGFQNRATGVESVVVGGESNLAQAVNGFVGGGICNNVCNTLVFAPALGAVVVGGVGNNTTGGTFSLGSCSFTVAPTICNAGVYSFVGGGFQNVAIGDCTFTGGGFCNITSGITSFTGGGQQNTTGGSRSFSGSGQCNTTTANCGFTGGGQQNTTSGYASFTGAGRQNTTSGNYSFTGGGFCNITSGNASFTGGGCRNLSQAVSGFIGGGICNNVCNATSGCLAIGSVVVGGIGNNTTGGTWALASCSFTVAPTICNAGQYSFVGGGFQNSAVGNNSGVLGGSSNVASCACSFIVGSNITSDRTCATFVNNLSIKNIPTSSAGLPAGSVWSNSGVLNIV